MPHGCFLYALSSTGTHPRDTTFVAGEGPPSRSVTGLHHCMRVQWGQIYISSTETSVRYQGCLLVEEWQGMGQVTLLVCHHEEASTALLMKCGVKGDARSPPAKSQQRLHRTTGWFQVHAGHHLVMWQQGKPFSLSQRPVISGAKGSGAICCIT